MDGRTVSSMATVLISLTDKIRKVSGLRADEFDGLIPRVLPNNKKLRNELRKKRMKLLNERWFNFQMYNIRIKIRTRVINLMAQLSVIDS